MRVAVYNQMFALDGSTSLTNLAGHWAVHFRRSPSSVYEAADLSQTVATVESADADVVGICEVFGEQTSELRRRLLRIGYKHCFFGGGHKTRFSDLRISVAVASRIPSTKLKSDGFPVVHAIGGGGGYVRCRLPALDTDVYCVHLAPSFRGDIRPRQIQFLKDELGKARSRIICFGDFNASFDDIGCHFCNLNIASRRVPTCS